MFDRLFVSLVLVVGLAGLVNGCGDDSGGSTCGPGTHDENGVCVVDSDDGSTGTGTQTGSCHGIIEGDYKIETRDDIDALAGYCEITGNLSLSEQSTLTSCSLPALTVVGGDLRVFSPALTSFSLPALTSVGGLHVVSTALPSFSLRALTSIGGTLSLSDNSALTSISLPELTIVGGDCRIMNNTVLSSFSLPKLTAVGGELYIDNNDILTSFSFAVLTSVGGDLSLSKNTTLAQCLVNALVEQIEAGEGLGGSTLLWFNNPNCTCSEVGGVLEATCP
jgi:hypothetical protein